MVVYSSQPASFVLPADLLTCCNYPLTYHPNGDEIAKQSVEWLVSNCPDLSTQGRRALSGLQAGNFVAFCYNTATSERLRVVSDFMNYLFFLDNISDGMVTQESDVKMLSDVVMKALSLSDAYMPSTASEKKKLIEEPVPGKLARDFWARCVTDAGLGMQERFKEAFKLFFQASHMQAKGRDEGIIPDLETYINLRRDTSACKCCWALIEYSLGIDLPAYVVEHHLIQELNRWTNDFVAWSNDIFSYNVEQSKGDTHNLIVVLMKHHGHTLQSAIDYAGDLCIQSITGFHGDCKRLPSWGPEIDDVVEKYIEGLQKWIVGNLHWSFQTHRYFGTNASEVKKTRLVQLLPRKAYGDSRDVHA